MSLSRKITLRSGEMNTSIILFGCLCLCEWIFPIIFNWICKEVNLYQAINRQVNYDSSIRWNFDSEEVITRQTRYGVYSVWLSHCWTVQPCWNTLLKIKEWTRIRKKFKASSIDTKCPVHWNSSPFWMDGSNWFSKCDE